jgi:Cd2+/Zn2+-exporting ATPase
VGGDFRIEGMDCADEVAALRRALREVVPPEALRFDVLKGRMSVIAPADRRQILDAVAGTGMKAEPWVEPTVSSDVNAPQRWGRREILVAASAVATVAGFATHAALAGWRAAIGNEGAAASGGVPIAAIVPYSVAIAAGLWIVLPKAWFAARALRPDMNLLMTVAVGGAIGLGAWFEAATVACLFALSLALEAWSVGRARRAVSALMSLAPDVVRVVRDGRAVEVAPSEVAPGTAFHVLPGERFPLDGRVTEGTSEVDQAPITGESVPVPKAPGDEVYAGTINGSAALTVASTKAPTDTLLARITRLVADSQARRAESEVWVDKFARIYTPVVLALAVVVAVVPPVVLGSPWTPWFYRALVLLVIGCPCALVVSTPVSIVAALASAARHGVLLKGGRLVELPATIRVLALDKTGTLTLGRPEVVEVVPLAEHDERALLARAAAIEARSQHPLAQAVLAYARKLGVEPVPATDVRAAHGRGVQGQIDGRLFWLGSHRMLEERGQETPELHARLEAMSSAGRTVVVVGNDDHVCGFLGVRDTVRPDAADAVRRLHAAGIERVVMWTGDNRATAEAVAREVGVDEFHAELLPEDKVALVEAGERDVGRVAMVGDGVNDAPALARATLGIAMGGGGTDVAIETADVALVSDDLGKLAWLVEHSRRTLRVIRTDIALAIGTKVLFVALTFAGLSSLWGAIAADMGTSLVVVGLALRLLRDPMTSPAEVAA